LYVLWVVVGVERVRVFVGKDVEEDVEEEEEKKMERDTKCRNAVQCNAMI